MAASEETTGKPAVARKRKRGDENTTVPGIFTRSRSELFVHRTRSGRSRPDPCRSYAGNEAIADGVKTLYRRARGEVSPSRMDSRGGTMKDLRSRRVFSPASVSRDSDSNDESTEATDLKVKKVEVNPVIVAHCSVESGEGVATIVGFGESDAIEKKEVGKEIRFVDTDTKSENEVFQVHSLHLSEGGDIRTSNALETTPLVGISERIDGGGCPQDGRRDLEYGDVKKGEHGYFRDDSDVELRDCEEEIDKFIASILDIPDSNDSLGQLDESCELGADGDLTVPRSTNEVLYDVGGCHHFSGNATECGAAGERQTDSSGVDLRINPTEFVFLQKRVEGVDDKHETSQEEFSRDADLVKFQEADHPLFNPENSQVVNPSSEGAVPADKTVGKEGDQVRMKIDPPSVQIASTPSTARRKPIKIFHQSGSPSYRKLLPFLMNLAKNNSHDFEVKPRMPPSKCIRKRPQKEEVPVLS